MPDKMRALTIERPGPEGILALRDLPRPEAGQGEILIRTAYASVNRADLHQVAGHYPAPEETRMIPGLELSGTVAALGEGVTGRQLGDRVCALLKGGAYAEYATVPAGHLLPVPSNLDFRQAAALPEALATVWLAVFRLGGLKAGETLVIEGGASSIGLAAIQLGRLFGAKVIATARGAQKRAFCESLGALALESDPAHLAERVREATGGAGADLVLDMLGGEYAQANIALLRYGGRIVTIALNAGRQVSLDAGPLLMKNLSWRGMTLRSQPDSLKAGLLAELHEKVWPWIESGAYRPIIDRAYPLAEREKAHKSLESRLHLGKILLEIGG